MRSAERQFLIMALSPALAPVFLMTIYPVATAFYYSLIAYDITRPIGAFVGLKNYAAALNSPGLYQSIMATIVFVVAVLPIIVILALATGWILTRNFRGVQLVRVIFFIPWGIPYIVSGGNWKWVWDGSYGVINAILLQLGIITSYQAWLSDPNAAMFAVILGHIWYELPFAAMLIVAGIGSVPQELLEAATIDGAKAFTVFRRVILTWLRPIFQIVFIYETLNAIKVFDIVMGITKGGPFESTNMISYDVYRVTFLFTDFGAGSALSVILVAISLVLIVLYLRLIKVPKLR